MNHFNRQKNSFLIATFAVLFLTKLAIAETPIGWRGDGTGKYPAADPPTEWSRVSEAVNRLGYSAEMPPGADEGAGMADGVIREWLVAGPIPFTRQGEEDIALADEAGLTPSENKPAGETKWRKVTLDSGYLDFNRLFGKAKDQSVAAYAFTHIYSREGGQFRLNFTFINSAVLYLNGKKAPNTGNRMSLDLVKGWNRLLIRVSPGEKDWYAVPIFHARGKAQYAEKNIAWRVSLPGIHPAFYGGGSGAGSPIILGDKIYLQSEPHDLICLNKSDGKILWIRRASYFEAAMDEEKKSPAYHDAQELAGKIDAINSAIVAAKPAQAQLEQKAKFENDLRKAMKAVDRKKYAGNEIPDVGFSGFTPSTDGQFIYTWFGDGVTACFTLDGQQKWLRVDQRAAVEHGFSSSPLLIDGKFIVFMRDLMAFDCQSGQPVWTTPIVSHEGLNPGNFVHGSHVGGKIGQTSVIFLGNGIIVRASDGKILFQDKKTDTQAVPSPVVDGKYVFHFAAQNSELVIREIPAEITEPLILKERRIRIDTSAYPKHYLPWHLSSPVIHDGLAYLLNNAGLLTVIDIETATILYQKLLDLDPLQAHNEGAARGQGTSPALAGKYLYFLGNNGAALVLEPGRTYKQIAKNKIESQAMVGHWAERQERFVANPIFDENRIYIRGEESFYAIGR